MESALFVYMNFYLKSNVNNTAFEFGSKEQQIFNLTFFLTFVDMMYDQNLGATTVASLNHKKYISVKQDK
jgi:hypothetical protein